ncbi:MAG TPA: dihydropteroate synthase [Candidatus Brocadiaceae bacterium]
MRQAVVINNPRVIGYNYLEGVKCEIKNTNDIKNKKQVLSQSEFYVLKFDKLSSQAYKLLKKNTSLSHHENSLPFFDYSNKLLYTTRGQLEHITACDDTPWLNKLIMNIAEDTICNFKREYFDVSYPHGKLHLGGKTRIMGILNVTPDSFYDGKRFNTVESAIAHAHKMVEEGADIIDIGGESTRPGAYPLSEAEEVKRVIPIIKILSKQIRKPISIDTYKAKVAEKAINAGASIINDIGGLQMDKKMAKVASEAKVPIVIMHKKGTPRTMQRYTTRNNLLSEIMSYLRKSISVGIKAGIDESRIILDPGIGFGKTFQHNLEILKRLKEFKSLGFPILIGISRKKFIGTILKLSAQERLLGTLATLAVASMNGAHIVRVHDVREAVQIVTMCDAIRNN